MAQLCKGRGGVNPGAEVLSRHVVIDVRIFPRAGPEPTSPLQAQGVVVPQSKPLSSTTDSLNNVEQTDGKTGAERRRYARLPMNLEAVIAIDGRARVVCAIKDFCVAGMFIQLDALELAKVTQQQGAGLYFRFKPEEPEQKLDITICRVIPAGLGVSFNNPPAATLQRLDDFARAESPDSPESQDSLADIQGKFSAEFAWTLPRLLAVLDPFAGFLIEEFTRQAAEALFLATREAKSNQDARAIIDVQMELRERGDQLRKRVPDTLAKAMAILGDPVRRAAPQEAQGSQGGLSLVDKDEFEQFLSISSVIAELEKAFREPLTELSNRMSTLARRVVDDTGNPVGPAVICSVYIDALKKILGAGVVSETMFRTLRRLLEAHLGKLYQDLNATLEECGIKPLEGEPKPGPGVRPKRPASAVEPPAQVAPAPPLATPEPGPQQGQVAGNEGPRSGFPNSLLAAAAGAQGPAPVGGPQGYPAAPVAGQGRAGNSFGSMGDAPHSGSSPGRGGTGPGVDGTCVPTVEDYAPDEGVGAAGGDDDFPAIDFSALGQESTASRPAGRAARAPSLAWATNQGVPAMQRALGSARAQLGWRRQVRREAPPPAPIPGGQYAPTQVASALRDLSVTVGSTEVPPLFDANSIGQRVANALKSQGYGEKAIASEQQEVIEVMVNLLSSLLQDPQLADIAKSNIRRLQGAAHRAAVMDETFFVNEHHPVRQLINRVAEVRPPSSGDPAVLEERVGALVNAAEVDFDNDPQRLDHTFSELEALLEEQGRDYDSNVAEVVQASAEQQRALKERRERAGLSPVSTTPRMPQTEEWERWLRRARALVVGERFLTNAGTPQAFPVTLVWIGEEFNPFVFADRRGQKVLTLTLEQVAMNLRRNVLKALPETAVPALERALSGVVERLHEDIAEHAAFDDLTGLMTRKAFLAAVERKLAAHGPTPQGAVMGLVRLENLRQINDARGTEVGDALLKAAAAEMTTRYARKAVTLGRLGGGELGLYWERGGQANAQQELLAALEALRGGGGKASGDPLASRWIAGLVEVEDAQARPEQLLDAAGEAALQTPAGQPVALASREQRQPAAQLKMVIDYVQKAVVRERLVLLLQEARSTDKPQPPIGEMVVSAEDRKRKLIPPTLFGQAVASSAHAWDVDLWTVRATLHWMLEHPTASELFGLLILPLSRPSLMREGLASILLEQLMEFSVAPARLCFSIADRDAVACLAETTDLVNTLKAFGCRFMLDEFGGGQGDYAHVRELSVDYVCLQRDVIEEARHNPKDYAMAKSINELAHFMGKLSLVRQTGPDAVEGWARELGVDLIIDQTRLKRLNTQAE